MQRLPTVIISVPDYAHSQTAWEPYKLSCWLWVGKYLETLEVKPEESGVWGEISMDYYAIDSMRPFS